jgi:hypothetical protein
MSITTKYSTLLSLSAVLAAVAVAVPACNKSDKPQTQQGQSTTQATQAQSTTAASTSQSAQAQSTIVLEVMGSGEVYAIWALPYGNVAGDHTTLPWSKSFTLEPDVNYVSLTWTGRGDATGTGCRITLDGKVVVDKPSGKEDCVWTR